jgi:hypothetical protein
MDTLVNTMDLSTLDTVDGLQHSVRLTSIVDTILTQDVSAINHKDVHKFCKKLLLGNDSPPSLNNKSLPDKSLAYVAKMLMGPPPVWKVVVTVVKVTDNLNEILNHRTKIYEQIKFVQNSVLMLSLCLKMIISDPRNYTSDGLGVIMSKQSQFTYMKKNKSHTLPTIPKRGESPGHELSLNVNEDDLKGAELLLSFNLSPPRETNHASPTARDVSADFSVMSESSDVMPMSHAGHHKAARMLEEFY